MRIRSVIAEPGLLQFAHRSVFGRNGLKPRNGCEST